MRDFPTRERLTLERILHPSDFSPGSEVAFAHALRLGLEARARVDIMHVRDVDTDVHWGDFPHVREMLVRWGLLPAGSPREAVERLGLRVLKVGLTGRDPVTALSTHAAEEAVDLIVLLTHRRRGLHGWLTPRVGMPVARRARARALFVPEGVPGFVDVATGAVHLERVVIAVDHAPAPQAAVDAAVDLTRLLGREKVCFRLLHVGEREAPRVATTLRPGWTWEEAGGPGDPVVAITAATARADCLVVATAGRHGFLDALQGSTSEQLIAGAQCPVLAIPAHS